MNTSTDTAVPDDDENPAESALADRDTPVTPDASAPEIPSAADKPAPADPATGHYGPGYGDPTRHQGNDVPSLNQSQNGSPRDR